MWPLLGRVRFPPVTLSCAASSSPFSALWPFDGAAVGATLRCRCNAGSSGVIAQLGERCLRMAEVAGSTPADSTGSGVVAQLGERLSGRQEVRGSSPRSSTGVWPASVESSGRQLTWSLPAGGRSWPSGDVVKPGVHAWLSARRSRVRISSSPLWKWTRKDGSCLESSQGCKAQQVRFLSPPLASEAQLVERRPSKPEVVGSRPITRSRR